MLTICLLFMGLILMVIYFMIKDMKNSIICLLLASLLLFLSLLSIPNLLITDNNTTVTEAYNSNYSITETGEIKLNVK